MTNARSFEAFCLRYFPRMFTCPFSAPHRSAIEKIEVAVFEGGFFSEDMLRGAGKTSLTIAASIYAALCSHRKFIGVRAEGRPESRELIAVIAAEAQYNDLLKKRFRYRAVGGPSRLVLQIGPSSPTISLLERGGHPDLILLDGASDHDVDIKRLAVGAGGFAFPPSPDVRHQCRCGKECPRR